MFSKILDKLNDLQPKQLFLLAGGAAVLMFAIIYTALSALVTQEEAASPPSPPAQAGMQSVVVAKADIAPRALIHEDMLQVKEVPSDAVPAGAVSDLRSVVGFPALSAIYEGDVITTQKVYTDRSKGGFVGSIPEECRAVSVEVSDITGVAGFARAGDYVDVVLTEKNEQSARSRMLLQNVLLLAINDDMGEATPESSTKATKKPSIATLALTPDEVLQLVSADALGEICLVLRPFRPADRYVSGLDHIERSSYPPKTPQAPVQAKAAPPVVRAAPAPAPAPKEPSGPRIEIIEGDQVKTK